MAEDEGGSGQQHKGGGYFTALIKTLGQRQQVPLWLRLVEAALHGYMGSWVATHPQEIHQLIHVFKSFLGMENLVVTEGIGDLWAKFVKTRLLGDEVFRSMDPEHQQQAIQILTQFGKKIVPAVKSQQHESAAPIQENFMIARQKDGVWEYYIGNNEWTTRASAMRLYGVLDDAKAAAKAVGGKVYKPAKQNEAQIQEKGYKPYKLNLHDEINIGVHKGLFVGATIDKMGLKGEEGYIMYRFTGQGTQYYTLAPGKGLKKVSQRIVDRLLDSHRVTAADKNALSPKKLPPMKEPPAAPEEPVGAATEPEPATADGYEKSPDFSELPSKSEPAAPEKKPLSKGPTYAVKSPSGDYIFKTKDEEKAHRVAHNKGYGYEVVTLSTVEVEPE